MKKVAGSEATRKRIAELMNDGFEASELMRTGMRPMIEQALEAEVDEALGRGRYARLGEPARGYRNGVRAGRIKTAEGVVDFAVPRVTGTPEPFASRVRMNLPERTDELARLAVEMDARGLSMRDIEAAFADDAGRRALSKSAASQVAERLWQEYQAFAARDLSGADKRLHPGQKREPVLAAWGHRVERRKAAARALRRKPRRTRTARAKPCAIARRAAWAIPFWWPATAHRA